MGYSNNSPAILLGAFIWWIACQTISHLLMSIQDEEGDVDFRECHLFFTMKSMKGMKNLLYLLPAFSIEMIL